MPVSLHDACAFGMTTKAINMVRAGENPYERNQAGYTATDLCTGAKWTETMKSQMVMAAANCGHSPGKPNASPTDSPLPSPHSGHSGGASSPSADPPLHQACRWQSGQRVGGLAAVQG